MQDFINKLISQVKNIFSKTTKVQKAIVIGILVVALGAIVATVILSSRRTGTLLFPNALSQEDARNVISVLEASNIKYTYRNGFITLNNMSDKAKAELELVKEGKMPASLDGWELKQDGIDVTVACDNACALLMQKGMVDCVIVGADRIAANGDSANKIGTFGIAVLAQYFGIPFYIAAPLSTIDPATQTGAAIPIEQRPCAEVAIVNNLHICPKDVSVYNFAFDVTPAHLITGIITEKGILRQPYTESITAVLLKTMPE